jgi:REP element-mobilizing transposase RayT
MFMLKPDGIIENIMGSVLGRALKLYPVKIHSFDTNINHFHCLFSAAPEQVQNISKFLRYLNGQSAKQLNLHYGRKGRVWSSRARVIPVVDDDAVVQRLAYAACNVVKDGMVEKASLWPGFSTHDQLAHGKRQTFTYLDRTAWWQAGGGWEKVPKEKYMRQVTVETSPLPGWEDLKPHERQARYRRLVKDQEKELKGLREKERRQVMGRKGLMETDPFATPTSPKKPTPMPKCHASTKENRKSFIEEVLKPFWEAYFRASALFLDGIIDIEFPQGSIPPPITTIYTRSRLRAS